MNNSEEIQKYSSKLWEQVNINGRLQQSIIIFVVVKMNGALYKMSICRLVGWLGGVELKKADMLKPSRINPFTLFNTC